jgi:hypothetical protein
LRERHVTTPNPKQRERAILACVYEAGDVARFADSEQPDFTSAVLFAANEQFGVEVTEFYLSESHARLVNLPGYVHQIFSGRYRHRDDRRALRVDEVTITRANATEGQRLPAIVQAFPDVPEHLRLLAEAITAKSGKARAYQRLHHLNLVLLDRWQRWGTLKSGSLCRLLAGPPIATAVWHSRFREIFYVTRLGQGWVYVPIVLPCLMAEAAAFVRVVSPYVRRKNELLRAFACYLGARSSLPVLLCGAERELELIHRRYGLLANLNVRDYHDGAYPRNTRAPDALEPLPISWRALAQRIRRYHEAYDFELDVVAPVKATPPRA